MTYPIEKYKFIEYTVKNEDGTESKVVKAASKHAGKLVYGTAYCQEGDIYDFEFGKKLAAARCNAKVCEKRAGTMFKRKKYLEELLSDLKKELSYVTKLKDISSKELEEALEIVEQLEESID